MHDPRYNSGTSLTRTDKEERIESFERALYAEFSDDLFVDLKKLRATSLQELHQWLSARVAGKALEGKSN